MQKVAKFPSALSSNVARFDYGKLFNGSIWKLEEGKDYEDPVTVMQTVRNQASRQGYSLKVVTRTKCLYLQATPK